MFFERHEGGERVVLVHADIASVAQEEREEPSELQELATSAGAEVVELVSLPLNRIHPATFIGSGWVERIASTVKGHEAELVIFNHELTPTQERNLEKAFSCRVIDRTGIILDIFASRAQTHEGKLQVELAQLEFLSTRLVRGWTHLERQKGGIGLRGPGESQLETDRRLLRARVKSLQKRLEQVQSQRENSRRARKRAGIPVVALVGYTNAGKSTLFNVLTEGRVYAADQLFATLDPKHAQLSLPNGVNCILADTVGFIRHLPHKLVESFKATLEETVNADLLLHVIDSTDEDRQSRIDQVDAVLKEIEADKVPVLQVLNKIDRNPLLEAGTLSDASGSPQAVRVSAIKGEGLDELLSAISYRLSKGQLRQTLYLKPEAAGFRAALFSANSIKSDQWLDEDNCWCTEVQIAEEAFAVLLRKFHLKPDDFNKP